MTHALTDLYRGLKQVGLTKGQVGALLPEWWSPEMAKTEPGLWETALLLGRRLNLNARALLEGQVQKNADVSAPRYKHTVRVTEEQLGAATLIASSLAKAVLGAMPEKPRFVCTSAGQARQLLLAKPGARADFDALLDLCWDVGIPVIPIPHLPKGVKKMDAAAIKVGRRPAIVIALKRNSKSWLSFLLAHELGHICLGHVPDNAALIEGSLTDSTEFDSESQNDKQEREANAFAHALLGGDEANAAVQTWTALPPVTLASRAIATAPALRTSPGHLVLRYAFATKRWPDAQMAMNFLAEDMEAQTSLVSKMREQIDTSAIAEDLQDFVEQITGVAARS
jgi:hypothetical protein